LHSARSTTIWVLLSLGAAFAVVAWSAQRGQSHARLARPGIAPALRAIDRPVPAAVRPLLDLELGVTHPNVISNVDVACIPSPCKAADVAAFKAREAARQETIRPARGTAPRAVAELPGAAVLLAWRNKEARLCLVVARDTGNATQVFGPCLPDDRNTPCTAICLASNPKGGTSGAPIDYLLAGTVSTGATALRITTSRTRMIYPLGGPILHGTDRRAFMLDLGRNDYRVLELLHGTSVIDSRELPAMQAAFEDCQAAHPAMTDFKSCIQGAAGIVPGTAFP
jgi:hypothetical protein